MLSRLAGHWWFYIYCACASTSSEMFYRPETFQRGDTVVRSLVPDQRCSVCLLMYVFVRCMCACLQTTRAWGWHSSSSACCSHSCWLCWSSSWPSRSDVSTSRAEPHCPLPRLARRRRVAPLLGRPTTTALVSLNRLSVGGGTTPRRQSGFLVGFCLLIRVIYAMLPPHGNWLIRPEFIFL